MSRPSRSGGSPPAAHRSTTAAGSLRGKSAPRSGGPPGRANKRPANSGRATPPKATASAKRSASTRKSSTTTRRALPTPFIPGPDHSGRRLAPAYDLEGPRVRLGIVWFVVVFAALGIGRALGDFPLVGVVYAAVAAVAAGQVVGVWAGARAKFLRWCAMAVAALVGLSASFGAAALGGALVGAVIVGVIAGATQLVAHRPVLPATALTLQAALPTGLVAASVVLTMRYEIGAGVILLAMVMAFDLGDFLIGSGAGSLIEGPLAGGLMIVLVAAVAAIIGAPPFHGALVWAFAAGAMVLCPLGQVVASWLLPDATTRASALRRLDSLLVLGPAWTFAAGLVAAHA